MDEAIENASEVLRCGLKMHRGIQMPLPSSFDKMRNNPEWAGWIFALANVGPMLFDILAERVSITLLRRVFVRLDRWANKAGETRSAFSAHMAMSA